MGLLFSRNRWLKVFIDLLCISGLIVAHKSLHHANPVMRGFYCDDESIRYPFKRHSTVRYSDLRLASCLIATFGILLVEVIREVYQKDRQSSRCMWSCYKYLLAFAFATLTCHILTSISKYSIGRLRPHFIDVCNPFEADPDLCSDPSSFNYITSYKCSDRYPKRVVKEARLSFMSGHSSWAAVTMIFLVFYMQQRVTWSKLTILKPTLQFSLIAFAIYVGFTRITDYWHHWSDVLVGLLQGTLTAYICFTYVPQLHDEKDDQDIVVPDSSTPLKRAYSSC